MSTRFTEMLSAEPTSLTHPHLSVSLDDTLAQQRAYDQAHSRTQARSASGSSTTSTSSTSSSSQTPINSSNMHLAVMSNSSARTGSTSSFSSSGGSADADDSPNGYSSSAPIAARNVKVWGADSTQQTSPMNSVAGVVGVTNVANRLRKKALGRRGS